MTQKNETTWKIKWKGDEKTPGKDKLGIADKVEGFAKIITSQNGNEVYGVTAPFGVGKTFFCECLDDWLKENDITSVFYNVWEVDFYEEPLVPLVYEILGKLGESKNKKTKKIIDKSISLFKAVLSSLKLEAKGNIPNVCDANITIDIEKTVKAYDASEEKNKKNGGDFFKSYSNYKSNVEEFKNVLKSLFSNNGGKPTVVIIDELDRCRPDYAIKLLETVKHFFGIEGLVFVIAFDEDQLRDSVKQLYGTTNFRGYITKFLDFSFSLPEPSVYNFSLKLYAEKLNATFKSFPKDKITLIGGEFANIDQNIINMLCSFAVFFSFSLRDIEKIFLRIEMISKEILASDLTLYPQIVVFLACVRHYSHKEYLHFKDYSKISDYLGYINSITEQQTGFIKASAAFYKSIINNSSQFRYNILDLFLGIIKKIPESSFVFEANARKIERQLFIDYLNKMDFIDNFIPDTESPPH